MGMTIMIISVTSLYFPLNRKLTGGFNLSTRFDPWILLWPVWVDPYLLCLPVWAAGLIWTARKMDDELFCTACLKEHKIEALAIIESETIQVDLGMKKLEFNALVSDKLVSL